MKLTVEAKQARIEWQSSGIRGLQEELGRAKALLAVQLAMQDREMVQRIAQVEVDLALHEAAERGYALVEHEEEP